MILGSAMGWALIGLFIAIPVYMLLFIGTMAFSGKKKH